VKSNPNDIARLTCEEFTGNVKGKYDGNTRMLMFSILAWAHGWAVGMPGEARPFDKEISRRHVSSIGSEMPIEPESDST
jgi:hypothetical protein